MIKNLGSYERQIQRVFGLKKTLYPQRSLNDLSDNHYSLKSVGYPTLTRISFFMTILGLEKWQTEKHIYFPSKCCVCLKTAQIFLPCYEYTHLWHFSKRRVLLQNVPHCFVHGKEQQAKLIATIHPLNTKATTVVTLTGLEKDFLLETLQLNQMGDVFPPWEAFPEYMLYSENWKSNEGKYWMNKVWWPFWRALSKKEKKDYLDRYDPPIEWRIYLTCHDGVDVSKL